MNKEVGSRAFHPRGFFTRHRGSFFAYDYSQVIEVVGTGTLPRTPYSQNEIQHAVTARGDTLGQALVKPHEILNTAIMGTFWKVAVRNTRRYVIVRRRIAWQYIGQDRAQIHVAISGRSQVKYEFVDTARTIVDTFVLGVFI